MHYLTNLEPLLFLRYILCEIIKTLYKNFIQIKFKPFFIFVLNIFIHCEHIKQYDKQTSGNYGIELSSYSA